MSNTVQMALTQEQIEMLQWAIVKSPSQNAKMRALYYLLDKARTGIINLDRFKKENSSE